MSQKGKGYFITLEGPEGSGKSSQAHALVRMLQRAGYRAVLLRDPGSTALGRSLRRALLHTSAGLSPMAEALLFIGGRVQLVKERIKPALTAGKIVVCDRFHDSTVAYQGFGGGLNVPWLDRLGRAAIHGITPSLTILLDVKTERGFARLRRPHDRMERKARQFHKRVRAGYLTLARHEPKRFVMVDASRQPVEVAQVIAGVVVRRLRLGSRCCLRLAGPAAAPPHGSACPPGRWIAAGALLAPAGRLRAGVGASRLRVTRQTATPARSRFTIHERRTTEHAG